MAGDGRDAGGSGDNGGADGRERRARRWTWVLAAFLLVVLAAGGGWWRWGDLAERRLAERVEQLRRDGQPVAPQDLVRPGVAGADNAAIDLRAAAALIDSKSDTWQAFQKLDFDQPLPAEAPEVIAKVTRQAEHRRALALLRQARDKPGADWQMSMRSPLLSTLLPDLGEQRNLSELARAAVLDADGRGDHAAVVEYLRDVLAIGRALDKQPVLVGHLVACAVGALDTHLLGRLAPDLQIGGAALSGDNAGTVRPAAPRQVRVLIDELLDEASLREGLLQALRDERVLQLDTAQLLADGQLSPAAVGAGKVGPVPLMPRAMILTDARLMLDHTTAVLAAVERSPDWQSFQQSVPPTPLAGKPAATRHLLATVLLPSYDNAVKTHYQTLAGRRLAAAALALRWYMTEHAGKTPGALEELVPKYLPSVPADPFAAGGRPLRYLPGPSRPLVYSVGENGTDEGGSQAPVDPRKTSSTRWEQQDAVFSLEPKPSGAEDK